MENENTKKDTGRASIGWLDVLLICISYTLFGVYIPLTNKFITSQTALVIIAAGICVVSVLVLARLARTFRAIIGYSIILLMIVFLLGSILPVAQLVALTLSAITLAFLILRSRSPFAYTLPALPLLIVIFATREVSDAIISVSAVPAGIILAYSVKNKLSRISAICRISVGICAVVAVTAVVALYTSFGEISATAAKEFIGAIRAELTQSCLVLIQEVGTIIEQNISEDYVLSILESAITTVFNLLPGIIITVANIAAYILHATFLTVCYPDEKHRKEISPMLNFEMSIVSGIVYILALILALCLSYGGADLWAAVAENAVLILAPGLVITALSSIRALMAKKGPSCLGTLGYFGLILLLATFSPVAIVCVALAGAVLLILSHISSLKSKNNGGHSN